MGKGMSQDVPDIFMMPMTFASQEFEAFVEQLNSYLKQIDLQDAQKSISEIQSMCAFYTMLLTGMKDAVNLTKFQYSDKKHYKYDLRACKTAHEQLMTSHEGIKYKDQRLFKPTWGHMDAYVWGILYQCYTLLTHANIYMQTGNTDFMKDWYNFMQQSTKQLNETKEDMNRYITLIESRSKNHSSDLSDLWTLRTLIIFREDKQGLPSHVLQRDWYIEPFSYGLPTSGGPREGGSYATFAKSRGVHAHITCDNIGGLLARMQKL